MQEKNAGWKFPHELHPVPRAAFVTESSLKLRGDTSIPQERYLSNAVALKQ